MTRYVLMTMLLAVPLAAAPAKHSLSFTKLWTHGHTTPEQGSEIPAFDHKTSTIWVAGVVGVDVLDAAAGTLVEHIDVTGYGLVNSVAIHNGLAAFAIEAAPDRRQPGVVVFYDTRTRQPIGDPVTVGIAARHADVHARWQQAAGRQRGHPQSRGRRPLYADAGSAGHRQHHRRRDSNGDRDCRLRQRSHGSAPTCAPTSAWISSPSTSRSRRTAPEPS